MSRITKPDALDWQEEHSPTEEVNVKIGFAGRMQSSRTRRRIVDARLWDGLTPAQQDAAQAIVTAYRIITAGLGCKVANYERADQGNRDYFTRAEEMYVAGYTKWAKEMKAYRMKVQPVLSVLAEGRSCRDMDRAMRKRKGTMMLMLTEALDLY